MITLTATTLWCHLVVSDSITVLVWCFEHWSYDILSTMLSVSSIRCVHACAFYILINPQDIFIFWPFNINNNNIIINFTYFFFCWTLILHFRLSSFAFFIDSNSRLLKNQHRHTTLYFNMQTTAGWNYSKLFLFSTNRKWISFFHKLKLIYTHQLLEN